MKNSIAKVFLAFLLFFTTTASAQVKAYIENNGGLFGIDRIVIDGKSHPQNFSGYALSEAMSDNAQAAEYAKLHEHYNSLGVYCLLGGLGGSLLYLESTPWPNFNAGIYWGLFGVGFFAGAYYIGESRHYLYKAINTYNGIPITQNSSFDFHLQNSGASAQVSLSF